MIKSACITVVMHQTVQIILVVHGWHRGITSYTADTAAAAARLWAGCQDIRQCHHAHQIQAALTLTDADVLVEGVACLVAALA